MSHAEESLRDKSEGRARERLGPVLVLLALICAGEAVFFLPFVVARIYRPTLLSALQLTKLQLGLAFSIYGLVALPAYLFGGPLADRLGARKMMSAALVATALGGFYYATLPGIWGLRALFGYWGLTTILLFWAPLLRATRLWGGESHQGVAYGLLDGGRGLFAAAVASVSVKLLHLWLPANHHRSLAQAQAAMRQIILGFAFITLLTAGLVWWLLPDSPPPSPASSPNSNAPAPLRALASKRQLWLQALIVLCAYVGYKSTSNFSLFAHEGMGLSEPRAEALASATFWVRPAAALLAGVLGDRVRNSRGVFAAFALMACTSLAFAWGGFPKGETWVLWCNLLLLSAGIYAARGIYFALSAEGRLPLAAAGAAIGLVSLIGYLPDVFFTPLVGALFDHFPGAKGHRYAFGLVSLFGIAGAAISLWFQAAPAAQPQSSSSV